MEQEHDARDEGALVASDPRIVAFLGQSHRAINVFAQALTDEGVTLGLVGPREVPRLWARHLLNSAAVASVLPETGTLVDVGSGAGLPGVVLAAMRPGLRVVLLEPMERRVAWLEHVRELTGLTNLEVLRGRAEDLVGTVRADVVTARAVAPMARLAGWTLPLLVRGGVLLALKGQHASQELEAAAADLARYGGDAGEVVVLESIRGVDPTTVVRVVRVEVRGAPSGSMTTSARSPSGSRSRGTRGRGGVTSSRVRPNRPGSGDPDPRAGMSSRERRRPGGGESDQHEAG